MVDRTGLEALSWLSQYETRADILEAPRALQACERCFAESFFAPLGTTDLEGQLLHIEQFVIRASEAVRAADSAYASRAKAYMMTGICVGACIGLALL